MHTLTHKCACVYECGLTYFCLSQFRDLNEEHMYAYVHHFNYNPDEKYIYKKLIMFNFRI